jgi:hypothetical protein
MSKTLLAVAVGILVGGAAYVMAAPADKNSSATKTAPGTTTTDTAARDVSGPCDEAEHAGDPRCAGPQRPEDADRDDELDDAPEHDLGDDRGGLRHEVEPGDDNGNRGPGSRNSAPGSSHGDDGPAHDVGDDRGGHGADDGPTHDAGDDHGGSGSGNSGSGGSGSGSSGSGGSGSSGSGHGGGSDD